MKKVQSEATRKSSPSIRVYCIPDKKAHVGAGARNAGKTASSYLPSLGMGYEVGSVIDAYLAGELVKINADRTLGRTVEMWITNDERFAGFEEAQMRRTIGVVLSKIEETQQALLQLAMKAYGDEDENFSG